MSLFVLCSSQSRKFSFKRLVDLSGILLFTFFFFVDLFLIRGFTVTYLTSIAY